MKFQKYTFLLPIVLPLFLSACDSKEMVELRDQQEIEITRLKGELNLLDERMKNIPPDRSKELATAKEESAAQLAEIEKLEAEVAELQERKVELDSEFQSYRAKYAVK